MALWSFPPTSPLWRMLTVYITPHCTPQVIVRMDPGEELLEQPAVVAGKEEIRLASVSGLGAVNEFTVGAYRTTEKQYLSKRFTGAFEIVSLTGTITTKDDAFYPHPSHPQKRIGAVHFFVRSRSAFVLFGSDYKKHGSRLSNGDSSASCPRSHFGIAIFIFLRGFSVDTKTGIC